MRRLHKIIMIYAALQIIPFDLFSQNLWKDKLSFQAGLSPSLADKRTDFLERGWSPLAETVRNNGKNKIALDFYISTNLVLWDKNRFQIQGGIGYLVNMHRVRYPIKLVYSHNYHRPIWYNTFYMKRNIYLPIDLKFYIFKKAKISLVSSNTMSFVFYKWIKNLDVGGKFGHFKKLTLEPSNLESFIGIGIDRDKFQYFG
ncbi:MAG: hypothetical protein WAT92_07090 [Saprospiraceae bacterium]|nr:hypothetical protein [Saprospiraceae bacterium]